jgi:hypothetical protein
MCFETPLNRLRAQSRQHYCDARDYSITHYFIPYAHQLRIGFVMQSSKLNFKLGWKAVFTRLSTALMRINLGWHNLCNTLIK